MEFTQLFRGLLGGVLMGLANLVPGVSGGTMLLAVGVYARCIDAVAKLTTLRFDRESIFLLLTVATAAALVILFLAGTVRALVIDYRWAMYSLFLGSTLGGIPVLWRLIGKPDLRVWLGALGGLAAMVITTLLPVSESQASGPSAPLLVFAGFGAFAAMMLPGLSGGYLLVLSGQYVTILGGIDSVKTALLAADAPDWAGLIGPFRILLPFAIGSLAALVGVSNLIRHLLRAQRSATLGVLLGLLAGAVLGLWPFVSDSGVPAVPEPAFAAGALALVIGGFAMTACVGRLGDRSDGS